MMRFYNSLTRRIEEFKPLKKGKVGLYSCGPTVHDYAHIGNFRTFVFVDLLHRYLEFRDYELTHVMNITDVEDRIIQKSREAGVSIEEFTTKYTEAFLQDLKTLRVQPADYYPKATEHINEMTELVDALVGKKYAYERDGSYYFDISKFKEYGQLSGIERSELKDGVRVDSDRYDKDNIQDFVLWKSHKPDEPYWETKLGRGRPGWHLECSAMGMKYLGETFDIHCGGIDLVFPHHENEIAQSEAATGKKFVNYWLHCAYLQNGEEKMSKSLGNFFTLRDLLSKGFSPVAIRYFLISAHYRAPLVFTLEALNQATASVGRLRDFYRRLKRETPGKKESREAELEIEKAEKEFVEFLDDDLNISGALGVVFSFVRSVNKMLDDSKLGETAREKSLRLMEKWDSILDVLKEEKAPSEDEEEIRNIIELRNKARAEKNWAEADSIRDELAKRGILLEDTPQGTIWKRKR